MLGECGECLLHRGGGEICELGGDHWPAPSVRSVPPASPAWMAFHTRSGVHGIMMSLAPNWRTASTTALTTAGVEAIVPASPTPLVPSVLVVEGVVLWSTSKLMVSAAVGTR